MEPIDETVQSMGSIYEAYNAFDRMAKRFSDQYTKAMNCLRKDK